MEARQLALAVTLLAAAGCASEEGEPPRTSMLEPLVELADWREVPRDEDPFVTDLDAAPPCSLPSFTLEEQWLEIDTGACNWVTLVASSRGAVEKGQELQLKVSHFDLTAAEPAEAVLRLELERCRAWQSTIPIPTPAAVLAEVITSPCAVGAGDNVYFHLHNHGQNNWQLQELSVRR